MTEIKTPIGERILELMANNGNCYQVAELATEAVAELKAENARLRAILAATPMDQSSLGQHLMAENERLRERLAEAERERDWFHLLAYAVLGHSISTYEVADQTIAIYSATEMVWADWEPHGESDEKTGLPKETAELRAKIEAAVESHRPVEDVQGVRVKITALEATLAAIRAKCEPFLIPGALYPESRAQAFRDIHQLANGEKTP